MGRHAAEAALADEVDDVDLGEAMSSTPESHSWNLSCYGCAGGRSAGCGVEDRMEGGVLAEPGGDLATASREQSGCLPGRDPPDRSFDSVRPGETIENWYTRIGIENRERTSWGGHSAQKGWMGE